MSRSAQRVTVAVLSLLVTSAAAAPLAAQRRQAEPVPPASMKVRITDPSGSGIAGVNVQVAGIAGIDTDSTGGALLQGITPGRQLVRVARMGFQTETLLIDFEPGAAVEMDAVLRPGITALQHAPLMVDARAMSGLLMRGFEHRKRTGIGTFLERDEIARWDHLQDLVIVFRRLRGFNVRLSGGAEFEVASSYAAGCQPQMVLDGAPSSMQVVSALAPHHVEAIEAYTSQSTTPPQFLRTATSGSCGTIVVWTRTGRRR
jgi:hypothetical protein